MSTKVYEAGNKRFKAESKFSLDELSFTTLAPVSSGAKEVRIYFTPPTPDYKLVQWETVADFTHVKKDGVDPSELLKYL